MQKTYYLSSSLPQALPALLYWGLHGTEVAFAFLTQRPRVRMQFSQDAEICYLLLSSWTVEKSNPSSA